MDEDRTTKLVNEKEEKAIMCSNGENRVEEQHHVGELPNQSNLSNGKPPQI